MTQAPPAEMSCLDCPSAEMSCLDCPLPVCRYDVPAPLLQALLRRLRAEAHEARSVAPEPAAVVR